MMDVALVSSAWHVISATVTVLLGAVIVYQLSKVFHIRSRVALGLYAWHSLFALAYIYISLTIGADSIGYFEASRNIYELFRPGTLAVTYFTGFFSTTLGMSYLGVFAVFNIIGTVGLIAFAGALAEVEPHLAKWSQRWLPLLLFLPGASFWSAAISKDAFSFFAAGVAVWGVLRPSSRWPAMLLAVAALLLVRPHIAVVMMVALAGALIFGLRSAVIIRVILGFLAAAVGAFMLQFALEYVGLENASGTADFVDYVEQRQNANTEGGSSVDLVGMSVPVRLFTYLFRPLFVDAGNVLGLASSVENLVLLLIVAIAVFSIFGRKRSVLPNFAWVATLLFSLLTWGVLANTTANLGIATRQKWMFVPLLLVWLLSYLRPPKGETSLSPNIR